MNRQTERMIRTYIRIRLVPLYFMLWLFLGSVAGFALIGALGFLDQFFRSRPFLH